MRALVTGATGKVGHAVASALAERGDDVRVLVRDPAKAAGVLPAGVEPVVGDVTDPASLERAVEGCEVVFNAMGLPEQWVRDESIFDRVNAEGTRSLARRRAPRRRAAAGPHEHRMTCSTPSAARGSTSPGSPTIRRGRRTSAPSSAPRSLRSPRATASRS